MTGSDSAIPLLVVAGEGGSLSLIQQPNSSGRFALLKQEMDYGLDESPEDPRLHWGDWNGTLAALERYPWRGLTPNLMRARYADRLQAAFHAGTVPGGESDRWERLFAQAAEILSVERHFHELIRGRTRSLLEDQEFTLPELPMLTAPADETTEPEWFPVPGMYGGFSYRWERRSTGPLLVVESWCRVVGGSGQRHQITANACTLVDEGFV